jgi:solute:Na+ symporter, SSS family
MTGILAAASAPIIGGVVGFLCITVTIGVVTVKLVRGQSRRYIVAGKSLPLFFVGTMLSAQAIDGNSSLGNAGLVYDFGFWAGAVLPLGLVICLLLTGFIFGKRLNKLSLLTLPDFYFRRYGKAVEGFSGILMMVSFAVLVAGNFAASGFIFEKVFGVDLVLGIFIAALIVLSYTIFGGLFSCAYTDIFQIYLAVFGFWAAFVYFAGGFAGPSWTHMVNAVPGGYTDFSGLFSKSNGALVNWSAILSLGLGDLVALDFMERVFAARDGRTASRGAYWGATVTLATVIPTSFIGIFAYTVLAKGEVSNSFLVFPQIAIHHVPAWIGVLMLAGVLGAAMSTANGGILAMSAVVSRNLLQRDIVGTFMPHRKMHNRQLLWATRTVMVPVMLAAFVIAWRSPQPGKYLVLAFDIVFAGALVPLIGGLFWKKANTPAALASLTIGSIARLIGYFYFNSILFHPSANALSYAGIETMIPPVISLVTFVTVALLTQEHSPGYLRHGIVDYVPPEEDIVEGEDLKGYTPPPAPQPQVPVRPGLTPA